MAEFGGKRGHSPSTELSKRFRDSGLDSYCDDSQDSQQAYGFAGTIKSIELLNFMCHKHLEIDLLHGVNFIIGRNGTGKSAILSALMVGLGGKATDTNRGYSLKEFIKTDEHTAVIKIVINNEGFNTYQPDVYGSQITVQRTIHPTFSQYKLFSANGSVVSNKHDDLVRLLMYLNLQVDNPVAILTQDTARNFLHNTKPTDKYIFFLKATRLEYIQSIYKKVSETLATTRTTQEYRRKRLAFMKEEKAELEKKIQRLLSVNQTKLKLDAAKNEFFWAKVVQQEGILKKLEDSLSAHISNCKKIDEEISAFDKNIEDIIQKRKGLEKMSETLVTEGKAETTKCSDLKGACEKLNNTKKAKLDDMMSKKEDTKSLRRNIESISKQIAELEASLKVESLQSKEDVEKLKKSLEDESAEIEAQIKTHNNHLMQLETAQENEFQSQKSLDQEYHRINFKIDQLQTKLKSLEGKGEVALKLFGPYVVALNREIKIAFDKGKFSKMPRGPLGSYLKVRDKSWAPAVEAIIGGDTLKSYIVNNHQDRMLLYSLIKKVTGGSVPMPTVTSTKFMDKVYDYQSSAVNCPGHSSVLDMLEVSDYVVTNSLIDLAQVETTLLVESPRAARQMMQNERNVPLNCKKVVTKSGDTYFPDPNYRCYSGDDRAEAKFLQVSVEDAKRALMAEISNCRKWGENTSAQKTTVTIRLKQHRTEIQATKKVLDELNKRKLSIRQQIMDLPQNDPVDASQINFWIEERETLKTDLLEKEEDFKKAKENYEEVEESYKALLKKYSESREASKAKSREIDAVVNGCHEVDNALMKKKAARDNAIKRKKDAEKTTLKLEQQVSDQKMVVEKSLVDATKLHGERIEIRRSMDEIEEEMRDLANEIERAERTEGDPREAIEKYEVMKKASADLFQKINALDTCITKMRCMLKHRRSVYSKCLQLLVTRMQIVFQSLIDRRRFQGGIEVDHDERKLDIRVTLRNPSPGKAKAGSKRVADSGDPKSLSGGERSFTTVAFILALWDAVELPFYALDEFDVYMDNANRELTLDLLKNHAEEKKDFQFVFLTPQPINPSLQSNRTHIFSLESHEAQRRSVS